MNGLLDGILTAAEVRQSPARREFVVPDVASLSDGREPGVMADPERHAPKLARMRTASGRPKLCLYAMFLFVYALRPSSAVSANDESPALIVGGAVFTLSHLLGRELADSSSYRPDCIAMEQ
jgi:hypothetical protein